MKKYIVVLCSAFMLWNVCPLPSAMDNGMIEREVWDFNFCV